MELVLYFRFVSILGRDTLTGMFMILFLGKKLITSGNGKQQKYIYI